MRYPLRGRVAVVTSYALPLLIGVFLALQIRPVWAGVALGLVFALLAGSLPFRRVRRRTLTLEDDVLVEQRDGFRLVVPLAGVTGVRRRRHQLVLETQDLLCAGASVEAIDSLGRPSRLPRGVEEHPALSRVAVSLYDEDWRQGPIGEALREHGVEV